MHRGGGKLKLFSAGSGLQARFLPENSPEWIQPEQ